ncbi:MAG: hypothetical protein H0W02_10035 [Ktedonobacteraceae bacterium]|nr:hypothetical protein [Ktedonobacteraceae bacterium]
MAADSLVHSFLVVSSWVMKSEKGIAGNFSALLTSAFFYATFVFKQVRVNVNLDLSFHSMSECPVPSSLFDEKISLRRCRSNEADFFEVLR